MNDRHTPPASCYHCGLPVPPGTHFSVNIEGMPRQMCCPGCQAVAGSIVEGGLEHFYRYRSSLSRPPDENSDALASYDLPEVQEDFVQQMPDGTLAAELTVTGITCAACAWLIEHHIARLPGVETVSVNVSTHRCRIVWDPQDILLSRLLGAFADIGYQARPAGDVEEERHRRREGRVFLLRLGLAGIAMMQAGHVAIALYAGAYSDMESSWETLLRWVSLMIVTPVVLFSAKPFFDAAWRSLKVGHLVMDVPVSLAIALAYSASVWATVTETGEVYFDSVSMFTFLLLLGRFLEMQVRHRNENFSASLLRLIPPVATRIDGDTEASVPVKLLGPGDCIRVNSGATIPCDGEVVRGSSSVIEAVLTGEQAPVSKQMGAVVSAGSVNVDNPLYITVHGVGRKTRLGAILDLVSSAQAERPHRAALADRLASYFVAAVLVIAALVALVWWFIEPAQALWVTLSVLVVTCPCALSLATPTALTVATGRLRRSGFLIRKGHVLETLAIVDRGVFDKTGTLTLGDMRVIDCRPLGDVDGESLLAMAAALEAGLAHPIARAFSAVPVTATVDDQQVVVGEGVKGTVSGEPVVLGKPGFVAAETGGNMLSPPSSEGLWLLLARGARPLGWIQLADRLRPGAGEALGELRSLGLAVELLSGDRQSAVEQLADQLGIPEFRAGVGPAGKLARIRELQGQGHSVLMVGDGVNDVPVLSGADVSVAMGDAVDITRLHADSLLISGRLDTLADAVALARKTRRIIRQNLAWALGYNLVALPAAVCGLVPPWLAAIGMSASSLLVLLNALRLGRGISARVPSPA
ncbi:MAG: ATPase [Porticoccaceae bacterium]|nr:ATPase [Porticoccaceae bacterium]